MLSTHNADEPYGVVVRHKSGGPPRRLTCEQPLDAVIMGIEYLRKGYHVLLFDSTVEALAEQDGADGPRLTRAARAARAAHTARAVT
jgi:hypothetical protein